MIYIEDSLAGIVRCAAGLGLVPGLDESGIFTDENAGNEWEGAGKVYVVRGEVTPVYDITSVSGNAECEISEIGIVSIAPERRTAQETAASVWASVFCKFSDESWAEEYEGAEAPEPLFWLSGHDETALDPLDEASVEYGAAETVDLTAEVKDCASLFHVSASDEMFLAGADRWKASAFGFDGDVSGAGVWIGGVMFAASALQLTFKTSRLGVLNWILDRYTTVPRAGDGSYRDEWFSTHTIRVIHTI